MLIYVRKGFSKRLILLFSCKASGSSNGGNIVAETITQNVSKTMLPGLRGQEIFVAETNKIFLFLRKN